MNSLLVTYLAITGASPDLRGAARNRFRLSDHKWGTENDGAEADIDTFLEVLDQISSRPRRRLDRFTAKHRAGTFLPRTPVQDQMEASSRVVTERVYGGAIEYRG